MTFGYVLRECWLSRYECGDMLVTQFNSHTINIVRYMTSVKSNFFPSALVWLIATGFPM